jgi:hypothetical protein
MGPRERLRRSLAKQWRVKPMDLPPALEFRTKVQNPEGAGYIEIEEDDDLALALEQPALRGSPGPPSAPVAIRIPAESSTISGVGSEGICLTG